MSKVTPTQKIVTTPRSDYVQFCLQNATVHHIILLVIPFYTNCIEFDGQIFTFMEVDMYIYTECKKYVFRIFETFNTKILQ